MFFILIPILLASLAGVTIALTEPAYFDTILISGPFLLASIAILYLRVQQIRRSHGPALKPVIIDGSNVMHWLDEKPLLGTVQDVVRRIEALGYRPGVIFDANVGYLLSHRYRDDRYFSNRLGLSYDQVIVVAKGTPADVVILQAARDQNALVVTNDRFREWADKFPEVKEPGFLIKGGYGSGGLWLDLKPSNGMADHSAT